MKHRTAFLTLAFVFALSSQALAQSSGAMDVVNKVVTASEVLDASALTGLYTDNAVFVDEGPIVIYGPTVGYDWLTRVKQEFAERKMTQFKATASKPTISQISANAAYIVVPMELNAVIGTDKHFHESGTFTFTLVQNSDAWKITSQVWTVLTKSVQ
jgi:ketosteroid isomerase-like protein